MSHPTLNLGEQTIQRTASSLVLSFQPSRHLPRMLRQDAQDRHFRGGKNLPSNLAGMKIADVPFGNVELSCPKKKVEKTFRDFETLSPSHQKTPHQIRIS